MLKSLSTPVGTGNLIDNQLVEVTINNGIELVREKLLQGYGQLSGLAGGKYVLLVDRSKSDYSVTFDAMVEAGNHPDLLAQALLVPPHNPHKHMVAEILVNFPRYSNVPIELFSDRDTALIWLRSYRDEYPNSLSFH